jgi:hypothetical protein
MKDSENQPPRWANAILDENLAKRFDDFCRARMVSRSSMIRLGITMVLELPGLGVKQ